MAEHEAMLTVLPNGTFEDGRWLKATIFVTPRLRGASELGAFDGFVVWPDTLDRIRLRLLFDGGPTLDTEPDPESARPSRDDWLLLFPDSTPVRDRQLKDLSDRRWRSYPFDDVLHRIRDLYADVAGQNPTAFPDLRSLDGRLGRLGHLARQPRKLYGTFEDAFRTTEPGGGSVIDPDLLPTGDVAREAATFGQLARFYDRPGTRIGPGDPVPAPPAPPEIDFHDGCAALGDYWELMRRVGLAVDVLVPNDVPASGRVRVDVETPDDLQWLQSEPMRPWTRYVTPDRHLFLAEAKDDGDLRDGMLHLGRERHVVTDLDVDGSGMKVFDFAKTVVVLQQQGSSMDPDGQAVPALRNGGITVARRDRASGVADVVADVAWREKDTVDNGIPAELWADDITRGYRIDVRDDVTGRWWSLCRRDGTYLVERDGGSTELVVAPDEGYVKGASAASTPADLPGADDDLYLHEAMFGWDGWSLVAPRPGTVFPTHPGEDTEPDATNPLGLTTAFTPQRGTLPALRFGRTYEVRARAVDLAANSWGPDDDVPDDAAAPPHTYLRWEPVPSPALVPRRPFGEGESLHRLVIRSTFEETTDSYVALARVQSLPGHETVSGADGLDRSYRSRDERHVLAPKSALQLAEHHGELDGALGPTRTQAERDAMLAIALREEGTVFDVPGATVVNVAQTPTQLPLPTRGQGLAEGETVVVDDDHIALPYLPDVLARGAAFAGLPGGDDVELCTFGADWPDRRPFRLVLVSGDGPPDLTDGVLTVALPPAHMARVRLSCHLERQDPARSDLDLLAVWDLLPSPLKPKLEASALEGQHWMLTPGVELVLVHAVEMPLADPVLDVTSSTVHRLSGETFASLRPTMHVHAKSTGRVDIDASWEEPVDDVMRPGPIVERGRAHVADFGIDHDEDIVHIGRDDSGSSHRVRHELGDTKHRLVGYEATATTRYREYFAPEITGRRELITRVGPTRTVHVPSSSRPDPPEVLYVVPTFRWHEEVVRASRVDRLRAGVQRTRRGGGLRVYLDRPWYSSGAEEMLGVVVADQRPPIRWGEVLGPKLDDVVLADAARRLNVRGVTAERLGDALVEATAAASERGGSFSLSDVVLDVSAIGTLLTGDASDHVSRWGNDPIWSPTELPSGPRIQSFTNHDRWDTGLSLFEVPFAPVAVAAFTPSYDAERRLWYCDIDIDTGPSYFPFVRLALARYQPYSIAGTHLSKVVLADFAQIVPDRSTTVRAEKESIVVTVRGVAAVNDVADRLARPSARDTASIDDCRVVVATIERTRRGSDLGWHSTGHRAVLPLVGSDGVDSWWRGRVRLPAPDKGFEYRLAVEEHELYETDPSQAEYWETTLETETVDVGPFDFDIALPRATALRRRMIYADHFALRDSDGQLVVARPEA